MRTIAGYAGSAEYWTPIKTKVADYGRLGSANSQERLALLDSLASAITAWEQNQARNWWLSGLDKSKAEAVAQLKQLMANERRELAGPAPATSSPIAQAPRRVERLSPGLDLPFDDKELEKRKALWNFNKDPEGEKNYNEVKNLIEALDNLRDFANKHSLIVAPISNEDADRIYAAHATKHEIQSSYHAAGAVDAKSLYRQAGAAGYDINNEELRARLEKVIGLYTSHYYLSDVARTGILLA